MELEQRTCWVEVLGQLHTRLRKLALLGLVVLAAAASDVLFRGRQIEEEQLRIRPHLEKLVSDSRIGAKQSELAEDIKQALKDLNCLLDSEAAKQLIKIECMKSLPKGVSTTEPSDSRCPCGEAS